VQSRSLTIAENAGQRKNPLFSGGQKLFHCKFWRRMQIGVVPRPIGKNELGPEPV
jgi:hypothetical protein